MYFIENDYMKAEINAKGAELASLVHDDKEYLWNADARYWQEQHRFCFLL